MVRRFIVNSAHFPDFQASSLHRKQFYFEGSRASLCDPAITIVGSRKASSRGREIAFVFAKALAELGWVIVSGLARGIDTAAHYGALEGGGRTLAIIGHGHKHQYPIENRSLRELILSREGGVLSPYAPSCPPRPFQFVHRNLWMAARSKATLIVEASEKSGSLHTANFACDLGKTVGAIAGPLGHPQSSGCHLLIQQGAKLVTSLHDLLDEI